jgi:hypothetical protein
MKWFKNKSCYHWLRIEKQTLILHTERRERERIEKEKAQCLLRASK